MIPEEVKKYFRDWLIGCFAHQQENYELFKHYLFVLKDADMEDYSIEHAVGYPEIPSEEDMKHLKMELLKDFGIDFRDPAYRFVVIDNLF